MSSDHSLFVQTVDGILWKPGSTHGKTPNLYVAIYRDGVEIQRTRTVKRELAPIWDHLSKILGLEGPLRCMAVRVLGGGPLILDHVLLGSADLVGKYLHVDLPCCNSRFTLLRE
ncbi:hypothetical protein FB451DRAFT_1379827 [Mycena latifolia]|nr:hypothetical protein FB451DRAFT_1379827 [Mycena latifolia]